MIIRLETPADLASIRGIHTLAFEGALEANIVDTLRASDLETISLVAVSETEDGQQLLGHIFFSPVTVRDGESVFSALGLGPIGVLPQAQKQGIGSKLMAAGLDACRERGHELVFVLGHAGFYPRFGFKPTQPHGLRWDLDCPPECFMVCELVEGALAGRRGVVRYADVFYAD